MTPRLLLTRRVADVIAQDSGVTLSGQPLSPPRQAVGPTIRPFPASGSLLLLGAFHFFIYLMAKRGGGLRARRWQRLVDWSMLASTMGRGGWGGGGLVAAPAVVAAGDSAVLVAARSVAAAPVAATDRSVVGN